MNYQLDIQSVVVYDGALFTRPEHCVAGVDADLLLTVELPELGRFGACSNPDTSASATCVFRLLILPDITRSGIAHWSVSHSDAEVPWIAQPSYYLFSVS